ncbi:Xaa-Pro dipeptidyl-peptidase [Nonomuraea sp. NBC_01738]|uniref:Xaa-Pro dipeptidyl-peptidase n=1 Tax=Nonomuraea sp. NBC_01738 TaxID=2976003 RepID=UPI002E13D751|nr:Xaa-Pro dipeptidyl-peptidase [Nonomuraea sp. NBC_01738]
MRSWSVLALPLVLVTSLVTAPAAAVPQGTQPIYDRADAITEDVFVEVKGTDTDEDGQDDRIAVRLIRPDTKTKVPVILEATPYSGVYNEIPNHPVNVDEHGVPRPAAGSGVGGGAGGGPRIAGPEEFGYVDNYFVPRGYAVAIAASLGTAGSTGCPIPGGPEETAAMKAVVDWFNGRARGFDDRGDPVGATSWSNGKVAMMGSSYGGGLALAAATTGVAGLKTIIPMATAASWYDYYRANGGVVAPGRFQGEDTDIMAKVVLDPARESLCARAVERLTAGQDRITGDYSAFWRERDYVRDAGKIRASVWMVHGLNDWNVKTKQFSRLWDALARNGVPRKLWLQHGAHRRIEGRRSEEWVRHLHAWLDYWLYDLDTGVMREPQAQVELSPGSWTSYPSWPVPGSRPVKVPLTWSGPFTDQKSRTAEQLVETAPGSDPNRLAHATEPLGADLRISGTPRVRLKASLTGPSPYLTALLVDYGKDVRFTGKTVETGEVYCPGQQIPTDKGCIYREALTMAESPYKIITRGWLDTRNRHRPDRTEPLRPGRTYSFDWDLQPQDYVVKKGHRLGVVLISTDVDYTLRYPAGTKVLVERGSAVLELPVDVTARGGSARVP